LTNNKIYVIIITVKKEMRYIKMLALIIVGRIAFGLTILTLIGGIILYAIDTIKEVREEWKD
jgi:hypothetical protein